jgi:hypothetical protein
MTDRKIASSKVVDFAGVRVTHQSPLSLDRVLSNPSSHTIFLEISMTQSTVTSRTIAVDHIKIESGKTFEEVRRALEETIPKLNPGVREFLRKGDQERANAEEEYARSFRSSWTAIMVRCSRSPAVLATRASMKSAIR